MYKFISVKIPDKDCKGISLYCDSDENVISDIKTADKLTKGNFKLRLQVRVNGKRGKKIFSFSKNETLLNALRRVAGKRDEIRETLGREGTLRKSKVQDTEKNEKKISETFLDRVEKFMNAKEISARAATIQNYSTCLRTHSKPLHDESIDEIVIDDIQEIISVMISKGKAAGTVDLYVRTLGVFLKKEKAPVYREWSDLELPEVDNKVEYKLNLEQTKKIIAAMRNYSAITVDGEIFHTNEEMKNIFAFLLTGRRIGEVIGLKYSDFNLEDKTFEIPPLRAKGKKKLIFNLDRYLMEAIESQAQINGIDINGELPEKRVFNYTRETPRIHFQNLLKALKLPKLRLHDIRHLLASTLYQNKVSIADISVLLGHSSIAVTEARYSTSSKDQATRATDAFNDIVG